MNFDEGLIVQLLYGGILLFVGISRQTKAFLCALRVSVVNPDSRTGETMICRGEAL
jgi:hypothetical protein